MTSPLPKKPRVAIVVQRYGLQIAGGAELHARWLAEKLQQVADIEVITTCAQDDTTWANEYPAGSELINGIPVHRFPVDEPRDWEKEQIRTGQFMVEPHTLWAEYQWLMAQGPQSSQLLQHLDAVYAQYDVFIFFTYLYVPTFFGLPLVADKALLIPTAHDEPFLNMPIFRSLFHLPFAIVYNTPAERDMVERTMRNRRVPGVVAGIGITAPPQTPDPQRFREKFGVTDPYILYVGRLAEAKNVPELIEFFVRYKDENPGPLKLVLMGKGHLVIPDHPDIVATGFVSEQEKFDGLAGAEWSVMPSLYESLSMIALESWLSGRPMVVNGRCYVMKEQCLRSQAGLYYNNYDEFVAVTNWLLEHPQVQQQLGLAGQSFVKHLYNWSRIVAIYQALFQLVIEGREPPDPLL